MLDAERRRSLLEAKLRGLARTAWEDTAVDAAEPLPFPGGAAMATDEEAWVLAEERPDRAVGPALALGRKRGARSIHLLASAEAGALARRASYFEDPPDVWVVEGRSLRRAEPEPAAAPPAPGQDVERFRADIVAAGADVVVEHGNLLGEVLGLEVARVVVDGPEARLEIGVGRNDREAHRMVHGEAPGVDALFRVVRTVVEHRRPGGEGHDAYHFATERWLRAIVVARPDMVGAASLVPVDSPAARPDLRAPAPAPAAGVDLHGAPVLVVCSAGVDVDLVPMAADARAADPRRPRLVLCVPEADRHRVTLDLVAALAEPAEMVTVTGDWRRLSG